MSERRPRRSGAVVAGLAATVTLLVLVLGVPALLLLGVGNPWPGTARLELEDTATLARGAAAALTWIVWARFTLAVLIEVPTQWRALRRRRRRPAGSPTVVTAPPARHRAGVGMVAARLVAAALVLLPIGLRATPALAAPPPLVRSAPAVVAIEVAPGDWRADAPVVGPSVADAASATIAEGPSITVADGDTLRGLARRYLGDADRWRDIFELNRDQPQPDGARLTSPSLIQVGWTLVLPAGASTPVPDVGSAVPPWPDVVPAAPEVSPAAPSPAPAPFVGPSLVTIERGDTLWDLTRARLEANGLSDDPHQIVVELGHVVAANPVVQDDPDLVHPGEVITFPAIGTPPPTPPAASPTPAPRPPPTVDPIEQLPAVPPARASASEATVTSWPAPELATSDSSATNPTTSTSVESTTTTTERARSAVETGGDEVPAEPSAPAPIGLGEAALLSTGVLALLMARRHRRLRAAEPRARLPEPPPEHVATERQLRNVDARERLVRVDIAVRAAAASLVDGIAQPAVIRAGADGAVELTLTADATLPAPWQPHHGRWVLPGSVPIEMLADSARRVGAPCVALTQLGVDRDDREVLVDLEALGVLTIHGPDAVVESVVRGVAATLASSIFAEPANLVGVGLDELVFLDHRLSHHVDGVEAAVELATTLVGTTASTASARQSTFVLRARHTSGELWEPAVIVVGPERAHEVTAELQQAIARRRGGLALVAGGDAPEGAWTLVADGPTWRLDPLGLRLTPVGLSHDDLAAVYGVLHAADAPLVAEAAVLAPADTGGMDEPSAVDRSAAPEPPWSLLVRLLGEVDVVDVAGRAVRFERSKTMELVAWLTEHRERSTRAAARSALWELDVRDATFANVVSEARRALARHAPPPPGEEWLERTLTERLPLHAHVVSDADVVRARLEHARLAAQQEAIALLRPAVELIRGVPFAGTGYLWPDPEGITSNLVLLATSAATELAGHYLSLGDVDGVFWATGRGLQVLPGHEELIALRMRAHHRAGDLAGVRQEWESYERALDADGWGDGEPAPKLVELRRELLSSTSA